MKPTLTLGLLAGMLAMAGDHDKQKGPEPHEIGCAAYRDCGHEWGHDKGGAPTPEPGTFVMMGLAAVGGLGLAAWRRRTS